MPTRSVRRARRALFACFCVVAAAALAPSALAQPTGPQPRTPPPPAAVVTRIASTADFDGVWSTTFGDLTIKQTGMMASGEYDVGGGGAAKATIKGKVSGQKFTFTYQEPKASGEGWFEIAEDGKTFNGQWKANGTDKWAQWNGTRGKGQTPSVASVPAASPAGGDAPPASMPPMAANEYGGLWQTSFGPMRLRPDNAACYGVYLYNGMVCNISGTVDKHTFTFNYDQPDGEKGTGSFTIDTLSESFSGEWKAAASGSGKWEGRRLKSRPGVTHLVVLEANWEKSLNDREFSFGDMLKSFFERVPTVAYHHRFVHDVADVQRFAGEVAFLPEPVVLYFSSHGSAKGLSMGGKTVTPEEIAGAVKGASNIKLLHFGACEVMAGDAPERVASAAGSAFPISGYANTADWGSSAIVDITYMDLVLEYGMAPAAAMDEVRKSITFANTGGPRGTIAPSALRIYVPGQGTK